MHKLQKYHFEKKEKTENTAGVFGLGKREIPTNRFCKAAA